MTRRSSSGRSRRRWAISIAAGLGVIGFVGAAQWNSSIARQEFITSAQRVLITQAEQAQREQERLRSEIEDRGSAGAGLPGGRRGLPGRA